MKTSRIIKIFGIGIFIIALQSCLVRKEYERPKIENESAYRIDTIKTDSTTIATIPWQDLFQDSYLQNYINQGLQANYDVRTAVENLGIYEAYLKQKKAVNIPTLAITGSYTHQITSENTQFGQIAGRQTLDNFQLYGDLSWEADVWGKIKSNAKAANADYLKTIAAQQAVKTSLISSIASSYYQLLNLDEQKRILVETIEARKQSVETQKALMQAGNVTQAAVNQTEALLLNAQAQLLTADNSIKLAENALCLLLAQPSHPLERGKLDAQVISQDIEAGIPGQLLRNRPDIIQAEYSLISTFELTNAAKASMYPSLKITAQGGFQSIEFSKWFDPKSTFLTLVGSLVEPIFNARQLKTNLEVAKHNQQIALINYEKSYQTASKEVSDALYNYQLNSQLIGLKNQEAKKYEDAITMTEELLNYGMANYLEVITARESALTAELAAANAKYNKINSVVTLYSALGGGWR